MNRTIQDTIDWFNQRMPDGGPVYTETDPSHWIVEPWNAASSLLVMIPSIYFLLKVWSEREKFKFFIYSIVLVMLGSIGSTVFHGLRSSLVFLLMDILPIAILTISLSVYFWLKILPKWWYVLLILLPILFSRLLFFNVLPNHIAINVSYGISGFMVLLPLFILIFKTNKFGLKEVILALLFFAIALFFRQVDPESREYVPIGTHFLWHVFSAFGTLYILIYLYNYRKKELDEKVI